MKKGKTILIVLGCIILVGIIGSMNKNNDTPTTKNTGVNNADNSAVASTMKKEDKTAKSTTTPIPDLFQVADQKNNMTVREISREGDLYFSLLGIRTLNEIQTAISFYTADLDSSLDMIYALVEVYNASDKAKRIDKDDISIYVDGILGGKPDTSYLLGIDGYDAFSSYEIDSGRKALVVVGKTAKKGWKEITVFAKDSSWKIDSSANTKDTFVYNTVFESKNAISETPIGDKAYSDKYDIIFEGVEEHTKDSLGSEKDRYVVFKFTINNTSSGTLDYSLVGYKMRGYQDGLLLDGADYIMKDAVGEYTNVYDIEEIKPGMTAKVYVAFPLIKFGGVYECVYDAGYITSDYLCTVAGSVK